MKLNKKGFMLAEVVVVSVVLISTIVGTYAGFNKAYSGYKERSNYDNIDALYAAKDIKDYLIENYKINNLINTTDQIKDITSCQTFACTEEEKKMYENIKTLNDISKIYFSKYDISNINIKNASNQLSNYINYLKKESSISDEGYRIIIETNNKKFATLSLNIRKENYDEIENLLAVKEIKDYLSQEDKIKALENKTNDIIDITSCNALGGCTKEQQYAYENLKLKHGISRVYFTTYNLRNIDFNKWNQSFQTYLEYLKTTSSLNDKGYRIIIELSQEESREAVYEKDDKGNYILDENGNKKVIGYERIMNYKYANIDVNRK